MRAVQYLAITILAASASLRGDVCCVPEPEPMCLSAGYNAPYYLDLCNSWSFYTAANFTYWQPSQENMELGLTQTLTSTEYNFIRMNFDFKPGFQVEVGAFLGRDEWDTSWKYTWFRSEQHKNASVDTTTTVIHPVWGSPNTTPYGHAKEAWSLHMDLADWVMGKNYYVTPKIVFHPSFGLRGAWIRQYVSVFYESTAQSQLSQHKSHSWGVGPSLALLSNWTLCQNFNLFARGEADILYTRYTTLSAHEADIGSLPGDTHFHERNLGLLRPHAELALGLSWGGYFSDRGLFGSLSAEYNFQVFFNQNMFRKRMDDIAIGTSIVSNGDLFMQGLTVSARLDF